MTVQRGEQTPSIHLLTLKCYFRPIQNTTIHLNVITNGFFKEGQKFTQRDNH